MSKSAPHTLYARVLQAAQRLGTAQALADGIGISLSAMLRGAKAGQLSTDTLLAIAEMGGLDPVQLLIVAGKQDTAARLPRLFGRPQRAYTAHDRQLLALDDDAKRELCRLIDNLTK